MPCGEATRLRPQARVTPHLPRGPDPEYCIFHTLLLLSAQMARSKKVKVIDLFAGAGGFSIGAQEASGSVAASLELDRFACETLRANTQYHGEVIEGDICCFTGDRLRELAAIKKSDRLIVVGGPPCQPFSKAAYWTEEGSDAAYRRARAECT